MKDALVDHEMGSVNDHRSRVTGVGAKAPALIVVLLIILILVMCCVLVGLVIVSIQLHGLATDTDLQTIKSLAPQVADAMNMVDQLKSDAPSVLFGSLNGFIGANMLASRWGTVFDKLTDVFDHLAKTNYLTPVPTVKYDAVQFCNGSFSDYTNSDITRRFAPDTNSQKSCTNFNTDSSGVPGFGKCHWTTKCEEVDAGTDFVPFRWIPNIPFTTDPVLPADANAVIQSRMKDFKMLSTNFAADLGTADKVKDPVTAPIDIPRWLTTILGNDNWAAVLGEASGMLQTIQGANVGSFFCDSYPLTNPKSNPQSCAWIEEGKKTYGSASFDVVVETSAQIATALQTAWPK